MNCNDCLSLIDAYMDGEAPERETERVREHLVTCANCEREFESLMAEQEIYARYDRELEVPQSLWGAVAARIASDQNVVQTGSESGGRKRLFALFTLPRFGLAFSSAMALLLIAFAVGVVYQRSHRDSAAPVTAGNNYVNPGSKPAETEAVTNPPARETNIGSITTRPTSPRPPIPHQASTKKRGADQGGLLFTDAAYSNIEERDTANHLEQAQDLLVSFRNIKFSEDDEEVDVSYEKSESRRLLNENIVLRRDAEMAGKFPAKSVLGSLEPFLIDIANLPDKASPADVLQIKDRVQKTEIVAELRSY